MPGTVGASRDSLRPLADRLRPERLDDVIGQEHLLGSDKPLRRAIEKGLLHSMVFWGPPGTGKTTLARLLAAQSNAQFLQLSAVLSGVKEIRQAIAQAELAQAHGQGTVLFIDEVHRFNKAQQDSFLPYVENGIVTFIGATTENPSFELNSALLSRLRVYVLKRLSEDALVRVIEHGLAVLGEQAMTPEARLNLARAADGDARRALNLLEVAAALCGEGAIDDALLAEVLSGGAARRFDKGGDDFYDQISALHKSVRGSDPDAALYWYARMLDGGCDPLYIARRVVRMAAEDIGNADPRALQLALNAWDAQERLGSPEGELTLAQAVVYMACAPKSNAIYKALGAVRRDVAKYGSLEVPFHIRNAPTKLMRELGHGAEYRYDHDEPGAHAAGQQYFPDGMPPQRYYQPAPRGLEIRIAEKLAELRSANQRARSARKDDE